MKMSRVFLVLGFVLIMSLYSDAEPEALAQAEGCCFTFFSGTVPPQNILEVKRTGAHCSQQGFIVKTPKFSSLCVHEVSAK
ncbi:chemokine (C-C motif) ligand 33, duplicate 3 [Clarias gariepinus]|uniref:C-C motif chemokine 13-like n=1 Tax=Clarias gariepinus TaxID=13013 RepID=UPI00234CA48A|nr:C-C motif chemokine 13-like [Clarias gariepinus]